MTKINSNPPQNFHYFFLMHRFMIFKRSVQYANFLCLCMCCCFQISLHWYAAFPFHLPLTPHTVKCRNNLISKYAKMSLYSVLIFGVWVWLGSQEPLPKRWVAKCTTGVGVGEVDRIEDSPLLYICFPAPFKLYDLVGKHIFSGYTTISELLCQLFNSKDSELTIFFFTGRLSLLSDVPFN